MDNSLLQAASSERMFPKTVMQKCKAKQSHAQSLPAKQSHVTFTNIIKTQQGVKSKFRHGGLFIFTWYRLSFASSNPVTHALEIQGNVYARHSITDHELSTDPTYILCPQVQTSCTYLSSSCIFRRNAVASASVFPPCFDTTSQNAAKTSTAICLASPQT